VVAVTIARLHPDKNLDLFVRAVRESGAVGWLVGDGPERERLAGLASGSRVRMLGYRADVSDLLGAADVFCLTSQSEGYGIAVVEALTAGLPVVATRTGAIPSLVADAGVLVDPGDADAYCRALASVVSDESHRTALRASAAERLSSMPDPRDLAEELGEVYRSVMKR
jgi:glycosyltransferase involved in cell wall biosynthesis